MRRLFAPLVLLALLAACGTPQERCIYRATKELRTVESLLAEVQQNLARGYALEEYEVTRSRWVRCEPRYPMRPGPDGKPLPPPPPRMCLEDYTETYTRRVAIDPASERRKRDGLIAKRRELESAAEAEIRICKQQYPE
ncbi:hypothetical protein EOM89_01065 [Candidatus Falkowbacteria bacterium]|nr:hypothetical protein [Candidatus Falkowbacteria bacterium]